MKAIRTKYLPSTHCLGARVKADDYEGHSVTISYPHELSGEAVYRKAADALCEKMDWPRELVGGGTAKGYVFCFLPRAWNNLREATSECVYDLERHAAKQGPGPDRRLATLREALSQLEE